MKLRITFLGTGTSQGIPIIGCTCKVCLSNDSRDKRLRTSIMISSASTNIVIDIGPDFRQQMLRAHCNELEAILMTHQHNDHIAGLDDVRPFNFRQQRNMPIFATLPVQKALQERFPYCFEESPYPGVPRIQLVNLIENQLLTIGDIKLVPFSFMHGKMPVMGFRFGDFTYITDAKMIPQSALDIISGTKTLVINALHHKEHHSHLNLHEALSYIDIIKPEEAWLIHLSHHMGIHDEIISTLPKGVSIAHDMLELSVIGY